MREQFQGGPAFPLSLGPLRLLGELRDSSQMTDDAFLEGGENGIRLIALASFRRAQGLDQCFRSACLAQCSNVS